MDPSKIVRINAGSQNLAFLSSLLHAEGYIVAVVNDTSDAEIRFMGDETLRDKFAAAALKGMLASNVTGRSLRLDPASAYSDTLERAVKERKALAAAAYILADAMLVEREKNGQANNQ
jgi:hypothetical protein